MRILINDFGGYPFPVQLSRYLAANGYNVVHTYVSNIKTPHGDMERGDKSKNLQIWPIQLETEFKKYSFLGRFKGEYEFAKKVNLAINSFKPDIFVSANTPLLAQSVLLNNCRKLNIKFIYWCQDIHSIAIENYLKKRLSFPGKLMGAYFKKTEIRLLEQSNYVITITNGFNDIFKSWGVSQKNISSIYNWGPINELPVEPKVNKWSKQIGVSDKQVILYSGTLGLKHNPMLIAEAVKSFKEDHNVVFIVISEGIGAEILKEQRIAFELNNLLILPYQDYSLLSKVLGSADVLISILEKDAARFSVPSKVLSYLCAQKPIILSVPSDNLSSRIVSETNAGFCVEPNDAEGLIGKIKILLSNAELRKTMGLNGRKYAEANFEIAVIAQKFIKIFQTLEN